MTDWVEDLESQIIDPDDIELFREAIGCLNQNFLRSSYIISWICLVESLKKKLYQLSNLGDKKSELAIKKIETNEEQNNSVDKIIYEESKNCGLIENSDYSTIRFLWEQRCLFAHPYSLKPEIDEVKHILYQSVKLSLGKNLFFNKSYLSDLASNLVEKPFFIPAENDKLIEYSKKILSRTPQNLFPFFFKTLLQKIGTIKDDDTKIKEQIKLRHFIIQTLENTEKSLEDPVWGLEERAVKFTYECFIGYVSKSVWVKLPERIKEILISYIETEQNAYKLSIIKQIVKGLVEVELLEKPLNNKYTKYLNSQAFDNSINYYGDNTLEYNRIISELESMDYIHQNSVIDYLKTENGLKLVKDLDSQKQFYLGRILQASAKNGHFKSQSMVQSVINLETKFPDYVIGGIAYGHIVNRQDLNRVDLKQIVPLVKSLNETDQTIQEFVYKKIFYNLNSKKADEFDKMSYTEELLNSLVINNIDVVISEWKGTNKVNFDLLIDSIKNYFA